MFEQSSSASQTRVLIASASAGLRRSLGDVAKAAELRAVGFIRDVEQLTSRTLLSNPDVLLLDTEMFDRLHDQRRSMMDLHGAGPIKIVLCGRGTLLRSHLKQDGIDGALDLAGALAHDDQVLALMLRKALEGDVQRPPAPVAVQRPTAASTRRKTLEPSSVVIGSSTGGPMALMVLLKALPADFPLPIAVVQHMPPSFTRMLADRLDAECAMRVVEAEEGMKFEVGTVYIAPGGVHMVLCGSARSPCLHLHQQEPENSCRPAVDVLFRSSAEVYGGRQHTIVLTGMGRDGLLGAKQLHGLGSRIVVQDAATSTVWGMPGAIAQAGYADDILPLDEIAPHLLRCL